MDYIHMFCIFGSNFKKRTMKPRHYIRSHPRVQNTVLSYVNTTTHGSSLILGIYSNSKLPCGWPHSITFCSNGFHLSYFKGSLFESIPFFYGKQMQPIGISPFISCARFICFQKVSSNVITMLQVEMFVGLEHVLSFAMHNSFDLW